MLCFRSVRLTPMVFWSDRPRVRPAGLGLAIVYLQRRDYGRRHPAVDALAVVRAGHLRRDPHHQLLPRRDPREGGAASGPGPGLRHAWYPCTIAALTTALGLGSLMASHIVPISKFGIFSAWGVMATLVVLFLFLPALLHFFPSRKYAEKHAGHEHADEKDSPFVRWWQFAGGLIIRHNGWSWPAAWP